MRAAAEEARRAAEQEATRAAAEEEAEPREQAEPESARLPIYRWFDAPARHEDAPDLHEAARSPR
jgi:hypothetical protein